MKWIVESHTGIEQDFIDRGPDHVFEYLHADQALRCITRIFEASLANREHKSPIVRLRYEEHAND